MLILKIHQFILDILFPINCISCRKEGQWLCEICQTRIKTRDEHFCPICEKVITPDGRTCLACKKKNALNGLVVASSYVQVPIANAVHLFKYRFVTDLHLPLGSLLVNVLRKTEIPLPDVITAVPLHQRRLRWRGFNQSALLAKHLSTHLLPQDIIEFDENILVRKRYTTPQMGLRDYQARQQNISDAFSVRDQQNIQGKTVLLVDDIATTGSTLFECARVLKNAGAKEVFAVVIARQETKTHN